MVKQFPSVNTLNCNLLIWHYNKKSVVFGFFFFFLVEIVHNWSTKWDGWDFSAKCLKLYNLGLNLRYVEDIFWNSKKKRLFFSSFTKTDTISTSVFRLHYHIHAFSTYIELFSKYDTSSGGYWLKHFIFLTQGSKQKQGIQTKC